MRESSGADLRAEAFYCVAERPRDDAEGEEVAQTRTNKIADGRTDECLDERTRKRRRIRVPFSSPRDRLLKNNVLLPLATDLSLRLCDVDGPRRVASMDGMMKRALRTERLFCEACNNRFKKGRPVEKIIPTHHKIQRGEMTC